MMLVHNGKLKAKSPVLVTVQAKAHQIGHCKCLDHQTFDVWYRWRVWTNSKVVRTGRATFILN